MAARADEGASALLLGHRPRVARVFGFHRVPVVGLGIDHLSDDPVRLQLFDRFELWVPAEDEGGDALHLGVAHGAVDALYTGLVQGDRLLDHNVTARLGSSFELLWPDVGRRA